MSAAPDPPPSTPAGPQQVPGQAEVAAAATASPPPGPSTPPLSAKNPRLWAFLGLLFLVPLPSLAIVDGWYDNWHVVGQTLFGFAKFWILIIPLAWLFLVEKRRPSWSPARRGGFMPALGIGLFSALAILVVFILIRPHVPLRGVQEMAARAKMTTTGKMVLGAAYWCLVNSLLEEFVWRWFVVEKLLTVFSPRGVARPVGDNSGRLTPAALAACILAAACFTAHHAVALGLYMYWPLALLGSVGVFAGGLSWSWLYWRYGSIWPGYVAHLMADLAIFAGIVPLVLHSTPH